MASRLRTVAAVVALVSLLVNDIHICASNVETRSLKKTLRRRRWLEDRTAQLRAQCTLLLNSLLSAVNVVDLIGYDQGDVADLLKSGKIPAIFEDHIFSVRFDHWLGSDRDSFGNFVIRLRDALLDIRRNLKVDGSGQSHRSTARPSDPLQQQARLVKKQLTTIAYIQILNDLDEANKILSRPGKQPAEDPEEPGRTGLDHALVQPLRRLRELRDHARHLFEAMASPERWPCKCAGPHNVLLKLESDRQIQSADNSFHVSVPRTEQISGPQQSACFNSFHIKPMISYSGLAGSTSSLLTNRTSGVPREHSRPGSIMRKEDNRQKQASHSQPSKLRTSSAVSSVNTADQRSQRAKMSVRFSKSNPSTVLEHPVASLRQKHDVEEDHIQSLCEMFISSHLYTFHRPRVLISARRPDRCHSFTPTKSDYETTRVLTLNSTYCDLGYVTREDHLSQNYEMSIHERLIIAASLASNTFQYQGTWLRNDWSCNDIVLSLSSDGSTPITKEMHVVSQFERQYAQNIGLSVTQATSRTDKRPSVARSVLKPLGRAVCDVVLGRERAAALFNENSSDGTEKAIEQLFSTLGYNIATAVRECLTWFEPASPQGFDDDEFSTKAFQKVIWPIMENLQVFEGKTSSVLKDGNQKYDNTTFGGNSRNIQGDVHGGIHYHIDSNHATVAS